MVEAPGHSANSLCQLAAAFAGKQKCVMIINDEGIRKLCIQQCCVSVCHSCVNVCRNGVSVYVTSCVSHSVVSMYVAMLCQYMSQCCVSVKV